MSGDNCLGRVMRIEGEREGEQEVSDFGNSFKDDLVWSGPCWVFKDIGEIGLGEGLSGEEFSEDFLGGDMSMEDE